MNAPCKDCEIRNIGCHSICKAYISFQKERESYRDSKLRESNYYEYIHSRRKVRDYKRVAI